MKVQTKKDTYASFAQVEMGMVVCSAYMTVTLNGIFEKAAIPTSPEVASPIASKLIANCMTKHTVCSCCVSVGRGENQLIEKSF